MDTDAQLHLEQILEYWVRRNGTESYSQQLYEAVKKVLKVLSRHPESEKLTQNAFVRSKIVRDYFIFYSFDDQYLTVIGFCDMRRDPKYITTLFK